jgi:hypothetical protein
LHFQSQMWQVLSVSSAPWWLPFLWGKSNIPRGQKPQNTRDPKSSKLHTHPHTHPKLSELLWHIPHDKVEKTPAPKLGIKEFSSTLVGGAAGFRAQMNFR